MENGGCFFVKKWTFPQLMVHYVQYQYFFILHFTYLGRGKSAYAPCAPPVTPLPTDLLQVIFATSQSHYDPRCCVEI